MLLLPATVRAGATAEQATAARGTIDVPLSISANQDVVLADVLIRASRTTSSRLPVRRLDNNSVTSTALTGASFIIAGQVDLVVSVAIPAEINLASADGTKGLIAQTSTTNGTGLLLPQTILNERGLLRLDIVSRVVLNPAPTSGAYHGLLIAIALYN